MAYTKTEEKIMFGEIEEIEDIIEKRFKKYKNFARIPTHLLNQNHHFIDHKTININPKSELAERIHKEWEILEKNLPSSIFVRASAERIDLMRAVIIGLEGTPYCHGLFFFDIFFPTTYPVTPPLIFYHSYGFDLNPNLHRDGQVSLDLLTVNVSHSWWNCKRDSDEKQQWNPQESNIMQVFVSIQHKVLNANPYYCHKGHPQKSNKEVFRLNCQAMLVMLQPHMQFKQPHMQFKHLVQGHFRNRAHQILQIYKAEMKPDDDEEMNQLFIKLLNAFEDNGAYCGHYYPKALKERRSITNHR